MTFLDVTLNKREGETLPKETAKKLAYDWRFENSINSGKDRLIVDKEEFKYDKWRTNSSLSNHLDTIMFVNELNINYNVTDQMHYDYLFYNVRKKKRYGSKKSERDKQLEKLQKEEEETLSLITEYYKYSTVKAKAVLKVLTPSQIEEIKRRLSKGGTK